MEKDAGVNRSLLPTERFNERVAGHLFVIRGDLKQLACSALIVPCDRNWDVVWDNWGELLPEDRFGPGIFGRRLIGAGRGVFADVNPNDNRRVRLVVTADRGDDESLAVDSVVAAISDFAGALRSVGKRVKPLVALPLVGTGAGGFKYRRGALIDALIPGLRKVAKECDVDVALVLRDERDHAAVQSQRENRDWPGLAPQELDVADRLGAMAASQELSLFLGAGVSIPLGLPDWSRLLSGIADEDLGELTGAELTARAKLLREDRGAEEFDDAVRRAVASKGCAPAHYLLAGLRVRQNVTTNYDTAYERALDVSMGQRSYRVLTRHLAEQPHPWLLKIHGDAEDPTTIVLTEDDYEQLENDHRALVAMIESLLMTSHLLFVGYSLKDPDFANAVARVRRVRRLAKTESQPPLATVLALHPGSVEWYDDIPTVCMLDGKDEEAARKLEIFLDRVSWAAARHSARSHLFVLDPDYTDLVETDASAIALRNVLEDLALLPEDHPARSNGGWRIVEQMLSELGARSRPPGS